MHTITQFREAAIINQLRQASVLADCPAPALTRIASQTKVCALDAGEYLFHEESRAAGFFIIQHGAIKLHRVTESGREQIIHVFRPYESLGEETLVPASTYPASACATEPSQVLAVPRGGFLELLQDFPELSLSLLRALGRRFDLLVSRLDDLMLKDVETRLANWLLQHCPNPAGHEPQTINLAETKRLLAAELGTCAETFSRTLAKLRDQKLLSVRRNAVTLLCPSRLAQSLRGVLETTPPLASPSETVTALASNRRQVERPRQFHPARTCLAVG